MDGAVVTVQVTDDGRGFDPAAVPPGHLGLQTMRERATAAGASDFAGSLVVKFIHTHANLVFGRLLVAGHVSR